MAGNRITLVVSDLAGTVVDFGSCAPAGVFKEVFSREGITVTEAQCREPMGMNKRDHITVMTRMPGIAEQCIDKYGKQPDDAFIDRLYTSFIPLQMEVISDYTDAIDGAAEAIENLRSMGIKISFTTGYNREMTALVLDALARQGLVPDISYCAEDVPMGRPKPWMIFRSMETLDIFPPSAVLKIGDTVADIQSGLNAGCISVGAYASGNMLGMGKDEFEKLVETDRDSLLEKGRKTMLAAGAGYVIPSVKDLPDLVGSL